MFTLSINGLKYNIFYSRIFRHSFCFNDLVILYIENISDAIYLSEKCVGNFLSIDVAIKDRMNIGNVIEGFVQMNCNIAISSVDYLDYINDQLKDIYSNEECGLSSILKGKNYHILLLEGLLKENHDATPYNQFMLDVLFLWYYNLNVKWKNVNSSHFKQAYIRATYFYNCGSTILNVNHDVTIDGNYIKDEMGHILLFRRIHARC
jgi:hypothetical protein